jgi:hypothetical protein
LTDEDVDLLRGVDCDILAQSIIGFDRILVPPKYTFFSENPTVKNFEVKRARPEEISRWVTD